MATVREIALEQALIAVIGAAKVEGHDEKQVVDRAVALLLGNNVLRTVDHPHMDNAVKEISDAHAEALVRLSPKGA
ncbi:hypothetical protein PRtIB026_A37770 [Pseudomonas sp. RtIB026]|uniref:hypothetical protein n=1 Tax=Pseudomonas sp. RtIB026 TaxID=2749999 RepID=UPI0019440646|nr:hypothetical protein [Pseudomonas sp. RtIB026]BDU09941.1 hypothetical protein PRtIB026_A37770 [Pseudomonas sp. RtIB026]